MHFKWSKAWHEAVCTDYLGGESGLWAGFRSDRLASVGVVFTNSLRIDLQVVPDTCTSCSVLLGYMSALDVVRPSVSQYTLF